MTCCKYSAGMLRHAVAFERQGLTADGTGGAVQAWSALSGSPTRGMMKAVSGGERFASARVEATVQFRLVVRFFSGLLESDRVMFRGKAYNIRFINNDEFADKWLIIDLTGGVAP